jgi:UDP-N-acetylglucosamine--N-acetylmuramyl-(pentapeptide) pyrophosphoryl-undecaprenol N-acetylglucosamine transferase
LAAIRRCRRCCGVRARRYSDRVHEQNAVLGRVNRLVGGPGRCDRDSYGQVERLKDSWPARRIWSAIRCARRCWRCATGPIRSLEEDGIFRVLVTGGSQGASIDAQPGGARRAALLPVHFRRRLQVTHQARARISSGARQISGARHSGRDRDLSPDMPEHLAWAHIVIARAGASTIAELTAAGRPAILVPLPSATDDHQTANAREITNAGGARTIPQRAFTATELAKQIQKLGLDTQALENAAARARSVGRPACGARPGRSRRIDSCARGADRCAALQGKASLRSKVGKFGA